MALLIRNKQWTLRFQISLKINHLYIPKKRLKVYFFRISFHSLVSQYIIQWFFIWGVPLQLPQWRSPFSAGTGSFTFKWKPCGRVRGAPKGKIYLFHRDVTILSQSVHRYILTFWAVDDKILSVWWCNSAPVKARLRFFCMTQGDMGGKSWSIILKPPRLCSKK